MVSRRSIVIYLFFTLQLINLIDSKCLVNPNFIQSQNAEKGQICKSLTDCIYDYLNDNVEYNGCKMGTSTIGPLAIGVMNTSADPNVVTNCIDGGVWTTTTPCKLSSRVKFVKFPLKRLQQYVVFCSSSTNVLLFPCEEQAQIQIPYFRDARVYDTLFQKNASVMLNTQIITCDCFCLEQRPTFTLISQHSVGPANDIDPNNPQWLRIFSRPITPNSGARGHDVAYNCSGRGVESWSIRFAVANSYQVVFMTSYDAQGRNNKYDAGILVTCAFNATLVITEINAVFLSDITSVNAFIYITYLDNMNNDVFITQPNTTNKIEIPENLSLTRDYKANCYLGDYSKKNLTADRDRYYYQFTPFTFKVATIFKTVIAYDDKRLMQSNEIEDQSNIMCNLTHYNDYFPNQAIAVTIGIIYTTQFRFPYSDMIPDPQFIKNTSTINLMYFRMKKNISMAVYCLINGVYSTPYEVVSGDRPITRFYNIFPYYDHKYTQRGFVYGCIGQFMITTQIVCSNCTTEYRLTAVENGSYPYIIISGNIRKNIVIYLTCTGKTSKYSVKEAILTLNIISYDYNDANDTYQFFMQDDWYNCVTKFIGDASDNFSELRFPMPTQIQIDGTTYSTDPSTKMLQLKTGFRVYQGCCLTYVPGTGVTCDSNWKEILVGNNFSINWSKNLSEIYPNNEIKCFACVNYTNLKSAYCINEHKANGYVGMYVKSPDGNVETIPCSQKHFSIRTPKQLLKPDNITYYKMSDFVVILYCCVRNVQYERPISMRSCNDNPPAIRIIPSDKLLFSVGESFSCTTDMLDCISGLSYIASITPEKGTPVVFRGASLEFTYNEVGNRVEIKCSAGVEFPKIDSRIVRVEQAPFEVVITGLLPILWYGRFLQCSAKGFPPPDIYWIQTNGSSALRVSDFFFLIGPWDFSGNYSVICEAKNTRGSAQLQANFGVYNSRIRFYESSVIFYVLVPILTILFIGLIFCSMLLTFQEVFFGVPLFSSYKAKAMTIDTSVKSKKVEKKG